MGRWFLEIGFESFAQDLATREGQRPRCPYDSESGSGDAAPPGEAAKRPMTKTKTPHDGFPLRHGVQPNQGSNRKENKHDT